MNNSAERLRQMNKHYDNDLEAINYFDTPRNIYGAIRRKELQITKSFINSLPGEKAEALDLGCNSGRYSKALLEMGMEVFGLDVASIPLKYAVQHVPEACFIRGSAINLPFAQSSFSVVICIELLHHFTDDNLENALREISRVIKPGGIFVFDLKNQWNPVMRYMYKRDDSVNFTLKTRTIHFMTSQVEKLGFKPIKKAGILFPFASLAPFVVFCARKN